MSTYKYYKVAPAKSEKNLPGSSRFAIPPEYHVNNYSGKYRTASQTYENPVKQTGSQANVFKNFGRKTFRQPKLFTPELYQAVGKLPLGGNLPRVIGKAGSIEGQPLAWDGDSGGGDRYNPWGGIVRAGTNPGVGGTSGRERPQNDNTSTALPSAPVPDPNQPTQKFFEPPISIEKLKSPILTDMAIDSPKASSPTDDMKLDSPKASSPTVDMKLDSPDEFFDAVESQNGNIPPPPPQPPVVSRQKDDMEIDMLPPPAAEKLKAPEIMRELISKEILKAQPQQTAPLATQKTEVTRQIGGFRVPSAPATAQAVSEAIATLPDMKDHLKEREEFLQQATGEIEGDKVRTPKSMGESKEGKALVSRITGNKFEGKSFIQRMLEDGPARRRLERQRLKAKYPDIRLPPESP